MPATAPGPDVPRQVLRRNGRAALFLVLAAAAAALPLSQAGTPVAVDLLFALAACGLALWAFVSNENAAIVALAFVTYSRLSEVLVDQHRPSINKVLVPLLALAIAWRWWFRDERPTGWRLPALLVGAYGVANLASIAVAAELPTATTTFVAFAKNGVIAVLLVMLVQTAMAFRVAVWALIGAGALTATLTLVQRLTGDYSTTYLGLAQVRMLHIVGEIDSYRSVGPVGNPNFYGQTLVVLVPLTVDRLWFETSRTARAAAAFALVTCTLAVVSTFSRGAFIGLVVVALAMLLRRQPRALVRFATVGALLALTILPSPQHRQRMATLLHANQLAQRNTYSLAGSTEPAVKQKGVRDRVEPRGVDYSMRRRVSEVLSALLMFRDHPFVGVGVGNASLHYPRYSRELGLEPGTEPRAPHNLYAEVLAETGLLGAASFGALLFCIFDGLRRAGRRFIAADLPSHAQLAQSVAVAWIGYLACAVFEHGAYPRYFWLLAGLALAARPAAENALALRAAVAEPEVRDRG